MPTATTTVTQNGSAHISIKTFVIPPSLQKPSVHSPKPLPPPSMSTNSTATIRPLYNRATRAFLHRDILLTHSLCEAAFAILQPPATSAPDALTDDRRKWDILRITLESTVYASNPSQAEQSMLPEPLLTSLSETPHTLTSKFYSRSLLLFTPADSSASGSNAAHIPPQVLATLVLASLKLECPDFARVMIEDWLGRREPTLGAVDNGTEHEDGYAKIIDLYCLHVLPKLDQWDYALEFLEYESELLAKTRERLKLNLETLHTQSLTHRNLSGSFSMPNGSDSSTPRPYSPAPSSSSSSSLSTTSTHTVVPSNRANGTSRSHSRSSSSSSSKSDATARAKVQPQTSRLPSLQTQSRYNRSSHPRSRTASSTSTSGTRLSTLPRAPPVAQSTAVTRLSTYSIVNAAIQPYLTTSRLTTLFLVFVVLPVVSLLIRRRRRARFTGTSAASRTAITNAELVRRRLGGIETGLLRKAWGEVIRVVTDTVKMAGSGLV